MGRTKDHMLIFTVGKQGGIFLDPGIGLSDPAGRAKPGLTEMRNLFLRLAIRALIEMETHFFRATQKHFFNIAGNTGPKNLALMFFCKLRIVFSKDLL